MEYLGPGDYPAHGLAALPTIKPWQAGSAAYSSIALADRFAPDNGRSLVDKSGRWISLIAY